MTRTDTMTHANHFAKKRLLTISVIASLLSAIPLCSAGQTNGTDPSITPSTTLFGTFERPFTANSLWNSRPRTVTLGTYEIPTSSYYPLVGEGPYSTTAFNASSTDSAMEVFGPEGGRGLWNPDAELFQPSIVIPRWPADTAPATGTDGHADIVDTINGVIHSFWQLKKDSTGKWTAVQYAWTRLNGRGWGDPAHYFQGARATAVPSVAGLIRKHEVNDGLPLYRHALAMSMTYNGLDNNPSYIFPATQADFGASSNTGQIPEGARLMLPASFDTSTIQNADLRKVANTLKTYGAYVIDRNEGTPFYVYVENGSNFKLMANGWDARIATDLQRIRAAMRQVVAASDWVDAYGQPTTVDTTLNLISMRGPWTKLSGTAVGEFDTWTQKLVFKNTTQANWNENTANRNIVNIKWATPVAGKRYVLTAQTTGGAKIYLRLWDSVNRRNAVYSQPMSDGATFAFTWPQGTVLPIVGAVSGIGAVSTVGGTLIETP